jgi:hypothetical protein
LTVLFTIFIALYWPRIQGARYAARVLQCRNNLRDIGIALQLYHAEYSCYPPAFVADDSGRPMHSWRVLLLPYIDDECRALYRKYRLSEPWDGTENKKLLASRPSIFGCPMRGRTGNLQQTAYAAATGPNCVFRGASALSSDDITDAPSQTLLIAEVTDADIPWTKPEDIVVSQHPTPGDRRGFSSDQGGGFYGLFADGSVCWLENRLTPATLGALVTCNGHDKPGNDF